MIPDICHAYRAPNSGKTAGGVEDIFLGRGEAELPGTQGPAITIMEIV
jgi:hypothetical protein